MNIVVRSQASNWRTSCWLLVTTLSLPLPALSEDSAQIDRLTQQWLDIERQTSRLQADWKTQNPVFTQRLALLKAEKQQLQQLLQQNSVSEDSVDSRRAELLLEQSTLEQQQAQLTHAMTLLTSKLQGIATLLPPVLSSVWQDEQSTLAEGAETSQQLQVALAQLTRLADFDQRVSVHEGTITTDEEQTILVKQLYLGTGIAWFVSRDEQQAGWGQADEHGWNWHFNERVNAGEISKAIAIFEKRQTADLVHLPIQLANQRIENTKTDNTKTAISKKGQP